MSLVRSFPQHKPKRISPDTAVKDGMADLADFCTDTKTNAVSEEAQATLTAMNNLYNRSMIEALLPAYRGLENLKRRNSESFGSDIPINHATVYKKFRDVLESLTYCLERDFDKELKQQRVIR